MEEEGDQDLILEVARQLVKARRNGKDSDRLERQAVHLGPRLGKFLNSRSHIHSHRIRPPTGLYRHLVGCTLYIYLKRNKNLFTKVLLELNDKNKKMNEKTCGLELM